MTGQPLRLLLLLLLLSGLLLLLLLVVLLGFLSVHLNRKKPNLYPTLGTVLSSEMDPAEIRLIRKVFIKERSEREKSARPSSRASPLKLQRHLVL
jgi:hypothetical protein